MTNAQIIFEECKLHNITEEVHTFAKWKSLGFKVKAGEHAILTTSLWKMSNKKQDVDNEESGEEVIQNSRMYLCKSFLFGKHQVEEIKK